MRRLLMMLVFALAFGAAQGCSGDKADGPGADQEGGGQAGRDGDEEQKEGEHEGAGVGDFIDYATGKLPIEKGRQIEKQVRDIQAEANKRLEDAMGE